MGAILQVRQHLIEGQYRLVVRAPAGELAETVAVKADEETVLKVVMSDGRFAIQR